MNQNPSFIDILKGFNTREEKQSNLTYPQLEDHPKTLRQFPHYESMQFGVFPIQNQNPTPSSCRSQMKPMRGGELSPRYQAQAGIGNLSASKDSKNNIGLKSKTLKTTSSQNILSRNNQILFQIKLKLASFVTKFNIDSKCLSSLREQSIESLLEMMFKKFKDYTKEHEMLVKNYHENLKFKEIQILNQQTKLNNLQEVYCQENNKWNKAKEKFTQMQKLLEEKSNQCEDLQQHVFELESIIKQQNQVIREFETSRNNHFNQRIESLQSELSNLTSKYNHVVNQSEQFSEAKMKLMEENEKMNREINQIMEQNKQYKNQAMFAKEACEKLRAQLEQSEEKLLLYYDRFSEENSSCRRMRDEIKHISEVNELLTQQIHKMGDIVKELQSAKLNGMEERQLDQKQIEVWRKQCSLKQQEIAKLKRALAQAGSRSRIIQKKSKSQSETSSEIFSNNPEAYISKQKHEQKIKTIIEEWKAQMEKTVDYYEKYIDKLQLQHHSG